MERIDERPWTELSVWGQIEPAKRRLREKLFGPTGDSDVNLHQEVADFLTLWLNFRFTPDEVELLAADGQVHGCQVVHNSGFRMQVDLRKALQEVT